MTALFTIEETPIVQRTMTALDRASETIIFAKAREHKNRHIWDRNESREMIEKDLRMAIRQAQHLLTVMAQTKAREHQPCK